MTPLLARAYENRAAAWRRYALRLTRDPADAADAVHDAIARTLRARPRLASEGDAHRYVLAAVRTSVLKLFRGRNQRHAAIDRGGPRWGATRPPTALDLALDREGARARAELFRRVERRLRELPAEQRQVVEMMLLEERPAKLREVAEVQGVPVSTVHSRLKSALRKLAAVDRD